MHQLEHPLQLTPAEHLPAQAEDLGIHRKITMSDPHAAYREAEKFIDDEHNEEALAALLKIVDEHETFTLAHLALARVYTKLGRHLEAVEHSKKACELEPEDSFNFTAMSVTCQKAWAGTQDKKFIQMAEDAMAHAHSLQGRG